MTLRKKIVHKASLKKLKKRNKSNKSFALLSSICITGASMVGIALAPGLDVREMQTSAVADSIETIVETNLVLTTSSSQPLAMIMVKPEVKPGESNTQRETREKSEADARAKEEERKKVLASKVAARAVVTRERRVYADPSNFDTVYAAAETAYGVDARLLRAIHYVETGCSGSTTKSNPSGATGPMQFLPSTFNRHGVDGNNDGIKDVHNLEDAVFSAAAYLRACGYPDVKRALWGYNRSTSYYYKVMEVARSLGFQQ